MAVNQVRLVILSEAKNHSGEDPARNRRLTSAECKVALELILRFAQNDNVNTPLDPFLDTRRVFGESTFVGVNQLQFIHSTLEVAAPTTDYRLLTTI